MKGSQPIAEGMVEAARELYLRYEGRQHERIEREMRVAGWQFYRTLLYTTRHEGGHSAGWIERFGWMELLTDAQRKGLRKGNAGRNYFEVWLREAFSEWTWTWKYQRYIYSRLARVTQSGNKRLMIFMPPRHGKSEMVTLRYTAWRLLQDPKLNVILGSYNQRLADRFSRKIRRILQHSVVSSQHSVENSAAAGGIAGKAARVPAIPLNTASEWETPAGGGVRSVGVGAGIAGFAGAFGRRDV